MKNIKFKKEVNVRELTQELKDEDFLVIGVSCGSGETIIHLEEEEEKDCTLIVEAHTGSPETPEMARENRKADYAAQLTTAQKISFIAKRLGLE